MKRLLALLLLPLAGAGALAAQDTTGARDRVRVILEFRPGVRPGLVVLPGPGLDSVRAIVRRDLEYSDRFLMVAVGDAPGGSPAAGSGTEGGGGVNYGIYRTLGADLAVELAAAPGGVTARLHDVAGSRLRTQQTVALPPATAPEFRLEVHRLADDIVRWASGTPGYAASRLLLVSGGRVYRLDSDGRLHHRWDRRRQDHDHRARGLQRVAYGDVTRTGSLRAPRPRLPEAPAGFAGARAERGKASGLADPQALLRMALPSAQRAVAEHDLHRGMR